MNPQNIFFNDFGRLRSGWRFAIFLLLFIFVGMISGAIAQIVFGKLEIDFRRGTLLFISVNAFLSFAAAIFVGWLCGKYLENLPFRALGAWFTKNWLKDLFLGLLFGAAALSFAVLIAVVFGGLNFNFNQAHGRSAIWLTLGVSLAVFIPAAAFEEVFFRGYILQTFARAKLAWLAIAMTSLFFASAHLDNPNASFLSTLNTALAGVWFGAAYLKTRTLWFVFGLHLIWNWMQGAVFGIEVSGITAFTTAPLLREIDTGPAWLTGASYGIEGGIACTVAIIAMTLLIWFTPILKPTEEMLALTDKENSVNSRENVSA